MKHLRWVLIAGVLVVGVLGIGLGVRGSSGNTVKVRVPMAQIKIEIHVQSEHPNDTAITPTYVAYQTNTWDSGWLALKDGTLPLTMSGDVVRLNFRCGTALCYQYVPTGGFTDKTTYDFVFFHKAGTAAGTIAPQQ